MSYGQQRRLEIARAMCTAPEMICLDEPAAGLNPVETATLSRIIRFLRQHHGITVLLIEHDMGMVMEISDRVIVLDHGDVIARGTPQEIQHNEAVIAAYPARTKRSWRDERSDAGISRSGRVLRADPCAAPCRCRSTPGRRWR